MPIPTPGRRSRTAALALVAVGFVAGIVFWAGLHTAIDASDTNAFCTSCHEMRDTVFEEYRRTVHFANRVGVQAGCADCHVPRDWAHRLVRKTASLGELYAKVTGKVDTPEKFEARRLVLAQGVWADMKRTDSRECRNCHSFGAMDLAKQGAGPKIAHPAAAKSGKTCIDCHKGIAHAMPKDYVEE